MSSGDLFAVSQPQDSWQAVEDRVNRLLENVMRLRAANAQLMKENNLLSHQMKKGSPQTAPSGASSTDLQQRYESALADLKTLQQKVQRMEELFKGIETGGGAS